MTTEWAEKTRLMVLYRETGNDRYRLAAEQLHVEPIGSAQELVERVRACQSRLGRPESNDAQLLYEMAEKVLAGTGILEAARQMVPKMRAGGTDEARAKRLDRKYRRGRATIERNTRAVAEERARYHAQELADKFRDWMDEGGN